MANEKENHTGLDLRSSFLGSLQTAVVSAAAVVAAAGELSVCPHWC